MSPLPDRVLALAERIREYHRRNHALREAGGTHVLGSHDLGVEDPT